MNYESSESFAQKMDQADPLRAFRSEFNMPPKTLYFSGNSLGLQPKRVKEYILEELEDWAALGVEGHLHARHPWLPYHENLTHSTARLVGAMPEEVVVMNTLSVNLHLMMVSFYRPTPKRYKVLVEAGAFPSDQYAVQSQIRFHGYPSEAFVELKPRAGEDLLRPEDILETIDREGDSVALILIGCPNYLTGQAYDIHAITQAGHRKGCAVGFDLAHGAGNLNLELHNWGPDFAVWCSYKYLNSGPGALGGCFIHQRHAKNFQLPRFCGWWGQNKSTRFFMPKEFDPLPGAEGWQLSNPPIFQLASLRASMDLFDRATMIEIGRKRDLLTGYLEYLVKPLGVCTVVTPASPSMRGAQLSLRMKAHPKFQNFLAQQVADELVKEGVISDVRHPDIVRVAPAPLYTTFQDVFQFSQILKKVMQ